MNSAASIADHCRGVTKEFGAGKTTLISIMAGLLDPTAGEVSLPGHDRRSLHGSRRERCCATHHSRNASLRSARTRLCMISEVGMRDRAFALPSQLSGGQQQLVAIARALVNEPRLLVCDEPTAALDAHSGRTVTNLIRRVTVRSDRAVIVVTHDNRVFDLGDRIISMADGLVDATADGLRPPDPH